MNAKEHKESGQLEVETMHETPREID